MEIATDIMAIIGCVLLANSAFAFFVMRPSETLEGEYSRKVRTFAYATISIGLIAASFVLG